MAPDALDSRMRTVLIGDKLGLHHLVTDLAAKPDRIHRLDPFVGGQRRNQDVERGQHQHGDQDGAGAPMVEVDARPFAQ
jgi:hypothetical protein